MADSKSNRKRVTYNVSPEDFVKAWQLSNSAAEAAEKLKMPKNAVLSRVASYRKKGVVLKVMSKENPNKLNIEKLNTMSRAALEAEVDGGESITTTTTPPTDELL